MAGNHPPQSKILNDTHDLMTLMTQVVDWEGGVKLSNQT